MAVDLGVLILLYLVAVFADFVSPYTMDTRFEGIQSGAPPTTLHLIKPDGGIQLVHLRHEPKKLDQKTFLYTYTEDPSQVYPGSVFCPSGEPYKMWGSIQNGYPPVRR